MHEAFSGPQRSGGSDASRLMPPPRQSPRHAPKQEVQRQAALAQPNRGVPSASLSYEEKGGADFSGRPGLRPSPKAQGTNGSESANGVAERPAALSPAASGSGVREPGLAVPVKQGVLGAGSRSDGGSGSRTPVEEGPLSPAFGHQAKQVDLNHSEPVPSASAVDPGKSPILYLGFETPVSLQPGSVLRSHSEQKKGAPSETKARTSNASDHETFFTPDNTNAGATPFTRSRLKAAQSPAKTPPQARAENTPQSHAKQATRAQESKLLGSTGRNMRGSSVKQPARGLSAFLEDEGDEGDPAFSLEFPLPEDEPPGPVAEEALGGGLMPEVPAGGGGAEERNVEAEGGSLKEVGRENGLGDGAKEDSERTESDRPKRDGLNGEADEAGEVNSAGAVLPSTPKGTGKASKGDRKSAGKTPKSRPKRHVDPQEEPLATEGLAEQEEPLATEGLAERSNRVRRSSRGVQDSGVASPTVSKTKGTETAAPKPSPKRANLGSTQKPPEAVESAKTGTPKSPQQRKGADKTTETSAVTPRSVDRAERLAKRRKLSGGRMKEIEEKEIEPGVGLGTERGGAGKKMEEGASGADVVPKEEADVKRMSESKKRSRVRLSSYFRWEPVWISSICLFETG